jgi:hypothetical protein
MALKSDPPQKIMQYWIYYSIWLSRSFPPDQNGQSEMFCISLVPVFKRLSAGPALQD